MRGRRCIIIVVTALVVGSLAVMDRLRVSPAAPTLAAFPEHHCKMTAGLQLSFETPEETPPRQDLPLRLRIAGRPRASVDVRLEARGGAWLSRRDDPGRRLDGAGRLTLDYFARFPERAEEAAIVAIVTLENGRRAATVHRFGPARPRPMPRTMRDADGREIRIVESRP